MPREFDPRNLYELYVESIEERRQAAEWNQMLGEVEPYMPRSTEPVAGDAITNRTLRITNDTPISYPTLTAATNRALDARNLRAIHALFTDVSTDQERNTHMPYTSTHSKKLSKEAKEKVKAQLDALTRDFYDEFHVISKRSFTEVRNRGGYNKYSECDSINTLTALLSTNTSQASLLRNLHPKKGFSILPGTSEAGAKLSYIVVPDVLLNESYEEARNRGWNSNYYAQVDFDLDRSIFKHYKEQGMNIPDDFLKAHKVPKDADRYFPSLEDALYAVTFPELSFPGCNDVQAFENTSEGVTAMNEFIVETLKEQRKISRRNALERGREELRRNIERRRQRYGGTR